MPVRTRPATVEQFLDLVLDDPELLDREFDQIVAAQDWGFPRPPTREAPVRPGDRPIQPGLEQAGSAVGAPGDEHVNRSVPRGERGPPRPERTAITSDAAS